MCLVYGIYVFAGMLYKPIIRVYRIYVLYAFRVPYWCCVLATVRPLQMHYTGIQYSPYDPLILHIAYSMLAYSGMLRVLGTLHTLLLLMYVFLCLRLYTYNA